MSRFLAGTRYLILIPILGLGLAAAAFFILGGAGLIRLVFEVLMVVLGLAPRASGAEQGVIIFEVVEYVHTFLIGTVLYITAMGFYQLFIHQIEFPKWLKVDSTEELETNLIGVTVVVLAVNFMGAIIAGGTDHLLDYGAGIALPVAALGLFVGLRAWSVKINKETDASLKRGEESNTGKHTPDETSEK